MHFYVKILHVTYDVGSYFIIPYSRYLIYILIDFIFYFLGFQIIHDLNCLESEVCSDYLGHVLELLSSCSTEVVDLLKRSILQGGKSLKDLVPRVINSVIETLVEKSVEVNYYI